MSRPEKDNRSACGLQPLRTRAVCIKTTLHIMKFLGRIPACLNPAISTANPPVLIVTGGA